VELARWLLRAEAVAVHRRFGCASLAEYVERRLGLSARELREKLRVARALETLPALAEALGTGDLSWSAVRELTRVATPETEASGSRSATGARCASSSGRSRCTSAGTRRGRRACTRTRRAAWCSRWRRRT
jgi:hypothetical protein